MKNRIFLRFNKGESFITKIEIMDCREFRFIKYGPVIKKFTIKGFKTEKKYALDTTNDRLYDTPQELLKDQQNSEMLMIHNGKIYWKYSVDVSVEGLQEPTCFYYNTLKEMLDFFKSLIERFNLNNLYTNNMESLREFVLNTDPDSLNNE